MRRFLLVLSVLLALLLRVPTSQVNAQSSTPVFSFDPIVPVLVGGTTVSNISLQIPAGKRISGVDAVISYDPTVIEVTPTGFANTNILFPSNATRILSTSRIQLSSTEIQAGVFYSPTTSTSVLYAGLSIKGLKAGFSTLQFVCMNGATNDTNIVEYGTGADIVDCSSIGTISVTVTAPTHVPTPTATPTPVPTATPVSTPVIPVCLTITKDVAAPVLGQQVRFTCGQVTGASSYGFRYRVLESGATGTIAPITTGSNISQPLTISTAGTYDVECQACSGTSCSAYTAW